MFAVIKTGGKQYKVSENDLVKVELLHDQDFDEFEFREVLMFSDGNGSITIGKPFVEGVKVIAEIEAYDRDKKVIIFKKRRRHTYKRKKGHRQYVNYVRIKQIVNA